MTNFNPTDLSFLFERLNRVALGFDPIFHDIENRFSVATTNYPPHNVISHADNSIAIEIAVAGFKRDEIMIERHQNKLTIVGKKTTETALDEPLPTLIRTVKKQKSIAGNTVSASDVAAVEPTEQDEPTVAVQTPKYHHKGISTRSFKLSWTLADHVEVADATLEDGILTVSLIQNTPEEEKPKLITIK
jgi:molecular chaperone IbpA